MIIFPFHLVLYNVRLKQSYPVNQSYSTCVGHEAVKSDISYFLLICVPAVELRERILVWKHEKKKAAASL
jgi:hypothetical protein